MEDCPVTNLTVDFANECLGGGSCLGCVQEEIQFITCPELLLSVFLCSPMAENEAVIMLGAERVAKYSGYADEFTFEVVYEDTRYLDDRDRRQHYVCAIDAELMDVDPYQFKQAVILRELNKAYAGFLGDAHERGGPEENIPVNTGKWGCGVFRGNP